MGCCNQCKAVNHEERLVLYAWGEWLRAIGPEWQGVYEVRFQYRFGGIAVERGLLTREQLLRALMVQSIEDASHSEHRPLGEVCVAEGYLTPGSVEEILEEQTEE